MGTFGRHSSRKTHSIRFTRIIALGCAALALALHTPARGQQAYVQLREVDGQLRFFSALPPGHHDIAELPVRGRSASVQLLVEAAEGDMRPVRQFRYQSWQETPTEDGQGILQTGFEVNLEPTRVADRFRLRLEVHRANEGVVEVNEAVIRRGFGIYYLSFSHPLAATHTVVGRAKSLVDLMLEFPTAYRAFEETAQQCTLPGMYLVPESQFSPSVVDAVMGEDIRIPQREPSPEWPRLVGELDHDDFRIRDQATTALREAGVDVVGYLQGLQPEELTLEQRARITYVVRSLTMELPPQPQPLQPELLRKLQTDPPLDWLSRLVLSSDERVRKWTLERLRRHGFEVKLPPKPNREERQALYDTLRKELENR